MSAHLVRPGRGPQAGQHCPRHPVGRSQPESGASQLYPLVNVVTLRSFNLTSPVQWPCLSVLRVLLRIFAAFDNRYFVALWHYAVTYHW